jgi:hypothetical protein
MEVTQWFNQHWFDLVQTIITVASFLLAAYAAWRVERAQHVSNVIAITDQHRNLLNDARSNAPRIFEERPDVGTTPVSIAEELAVINFVAHLSTVFRAIDYGEFVRLDGMELDVGEFFALPIPKEVWNKLKPFQERSFAAFVENCLGRSQKLG